MAWKSEGTRDINFILERLKKDLNEMWAGCQMLRELQIPEVDVVVCSIEDDIDDYLSYSGGFLEAINKTKERNKELIAKNNEMVGYIKRLEKQVKELNTAHDEKLGLLDETIRLIHENARSMEMREYMKDTSVDRSGVKSPRYRKDINDSELIKLYNDGWTIKQLADKFNMSSPGMMDRLKKLGVYKPTYKSNN